MPIQWPPVQSPSGVVVHSPVSGSAQCGKPSFTRAAVSCARTSIRSIAWLHGAWVVIGLRSVIQRLRGEVLPYSDLLQHLEADSIQKPCPVVDAEHPAFEPAAVSFDGAGLVVVALDEVAVAAVVALDRRGEGPERATSWATACATSSIRRAAASFYVTGMCSRWTRACAARA